MVVLKLPSQFPENRAVGDHFNFYEREGRFYQQIGGKLTLRTPRCYWNHIDPATKTYGLLLEDLGARTMISQVEGVGAERAAEALGALAGLHGAWWESPALDGLEWMPRLDDPVNLAAGQEYREAWASFVERIGSTLPPGAVELGERVQLVFEDVLRATMAEAPTTVCHGDFRVDNLLFDDDAPAGDRVAVIDWQIAYRGPAVTDVAYLLCQSMAVDERRRHEERLVRAWYDGVVEVLGADLAHYPLVLAWEQYRRTALTTTVYAVVAAGSMDPANERGRELVTAMAGRSFSAALDLGSEEFLP
jgi:aminoglycoside/choline kinase family phosphotransferase